MKKWFFVLSSVCTYSLVFLACAYAGQFMKIEPGFSTYKEVMDTWGKPQNIVQKTDALEVIEYDGKKYELKRFVVTIDRKTQLVKQIDIYPPEENDKKKYDAWFDIEVPFESAYEPDGRLVEYYVPQFIALHYTGATNLTAVAFFSHVDPALFSEVPPSDTAAVRPFLGLGLGMSAEEGYQVVTVDENSPASRAGIQAGDRILEIGDKFFYEKELSSFSFMRVIGSLPVNTPIRFYLKRGENNLECMVTLEAMTQTMLDQYANEGYTLFQKGQFLLMQNDPYGALDCFKGALWYAPDEPAYGIGLGDAYLRIGLTDLAIDEFKKAVAQMPQAYGYFSLGRIYFEKEAYDMAMPFLKKALAMDHKNATVWGMLGYCYYQKGLYKEALYFYERAITKSDTVPGVLYYAAACYDKLHDTKNALEYYKKYVALKDDNESMNKGAQDRIDFLTGNAAPPVAFTEKK